MLRRTIAVFLVALSWPAAAGPATCRLRLVAGARRGGEGCYLDERVTRNGGSLEVSCNGGRASARFGDQAFAGAMSGGHVELTSVTQFDFSDGCRWESRQSLSGSPASGALTFVYTERAIRGERCARACTSRVEVKVECEASCACAPACAPDPADGGYFSMR